MALSNTPKPSRNESAEGRYRIDHRVQIVSLLRRLIESKTVIGISSTADRELHPSALIEMDTKHDTLLLDEVRNRKGHQAIMGSDRVRVGGMLEGVRLQFATKLIGATNDAYRVQFPEYLLYFQNRENYRVKVTGSRVNLSAETDEGVIIEGQLGDISASGIGMLFKNDLALEIEQPLYNLNLTLPGGEQFHCNLIVRYLKNLEKEGKLWVGAQFVELSSVEQQSINRSIAALERMHLRARSRL